MTSFVVGTDGVASSEKILEYLRTRLEAGDSLVVVNSQRGGRETDSDQVREGGEAIDVLLDGVPEGVEAEPHQYVRGQSPAEDLLTVADEFGADEIVIAVRRRSPTGKAVFGSTAQDVLLSTDWPVVAVPLEA